MEDARNNVICEGQYGSWLRGQAARGGKQGAPQEVKLVGTGAHQAKILIEEKDLAVARVSAMGDQLARREPEMGGTSVWSKKRT